VPEISIPLLVHPVKIHTIPITLPSGRLPFITVTTPFRPSLLWLFAVSHEVSCISPLSNAILRSSIILIEPSISYFILHTGFFKITSSIFYAVSTSYNRVIVLWGSFLSLVCFHAKRRAKHRLCPVNFTNLLYTTSAVLLLQDSQKHLENTQSPVLRVSSLAIETFYENLLADTKFYLFCAPE
jgi:hypothetical protein